jgi:hypothetical protein
VAPDYASELLVCQRYWQKLYGMFSGNVTTGLTYYNSLNTLGTMRAAPAVSGVSNGAAGFAATAGTFTGTYPYGTFEARAANATTNAGQFQTVVTFNARM